MRLLFFAAFDALECSRYLLFVRAHFAFSWLIFDRFCLCSMIPSEKCIFLKNIFDILRLVRCFCFFSRFMFYGIAGAFRIYIAIYYLFRYGALERFIYLLRYFLRTLAYTRSLVNH